MKMERSLYWRWLCWDVLSRIPILWRHEKSSTVLQKTYKRRYQIYYARRASGITIIRYAQSQHIWKPNNLNVFKLVNEMLVLYQIISVWLMYTVLFLNKKIIKHISFIRRHTIFYLYVAMWYFRVFLCHALKYYNKRARNRNYLFSDKTNITFYSKKLC